MMTTAKGRAPLPAAMVLGLWMTSCALPTWSPRVLDATADADATVADADVAGPDADVLGLDADVTMPDADVTMPDADAPPPDVDARMPDADVEMPDVDAGMPDSDAGMPDADVPMPDADVPMPDADVPMPDADVPMACPSATPTRCGARCCAGPCTDEDTCEEIVGTSSAEWATCAWSRSGRAWCWGGGHIVPQLDTCTDPVRPFRLTNALFVDVRQVSVSSYDACALLASGALVCWGEYRAPRVAIASGVAQVVTGDYHTCARFTDGHVECRGFNAFGQLGRGVAGAVDGGTEEDRTFLPVMASAGVQLTGVQELATGRLHTCARLTDGTVRCWGMDAYSELGAGHVGTMRCEGYICSPTPLTVTGLRDVTALASGYRHTCARLTDGSIWCWGDNTNEQLCAAAAGSCDGGECALTPQRVPGVTDARAMVTGVAHTCFLRGAAGASTVSCCGAWDHGQTPMPYSLRAVTGVAPDTTSLASGYAMVCATAPSGVRCWGDGTRAQLATGAEVQRRAVQVAEVSDAASLAAGERHTCVRTTTGTVRCWGGNRLHQLSDDTALDRMRPVRAVLDDGRATPIVNVAQLSANFAHTCATRTDGTLLCWGSGGAYRLGAGIPAGTGMGARAVMEQTMVSAVSAGAAFTCSVRAGAVTCWGDNSDCQTTRNIAMMAGGRCMPTEHEDAQVVALPFAPVAGITAGLNQGCAWSTSDGGRGGPIACWGNNGNNEALGAPDAGTDAYAATRLTYPSTVVDVSAGWRATCAVTPAGEVFCWGDNGCGMLGRSPVGGGTDARAVAGITDATAVRVGYQFACALRSGGTVVCWGRGDYGQLGDGSDRWNYVPATVLRGDGMPLDNVESITAGVTHACARRRDNTVWCWGSDLSGELGDGNASVRFDATPVRW